MQRSPLRRKRRSDPVTPEMRELVLKRDGGCVAPRLQPWSQSGKCWGALSLDHVKDHARMGKRAPSDPGHLVTICMGHHVWTDWATSHRPLLREYLRAYREGLSD
jgi:hypothetical protein